MYEQVQDQILRESKMINQFLFKILDELIEIKRVLKEVKK